MRRMAGSSIVKPVLGLALLLGLSACGEPDDPILMNVSSNNGTPDEFAILPSRPLEIPTDLAALPEPTPGQSNRTDPTPQADAIAALGGNPARVNAPSRDGGIVGYASRYGVDPRIREDLAAVDLEFRRDNNGRILERIFNVNVYFDAYQNQALDQHLELNRFRAAGIRTVSAPPDPLLETKQ